MKKILITGSNGFVGQNIIETLHKKYEIFGFDQSKTTGLNEEHMVVGQLGDFELLDRIFEQIKPDFLIHLAAIVHKNNADTSEKNYDFVNYECSVYLFDLCEKYHSNIIFASTIEVFGHHDLEVIDETVECQPESFYAKSKLKAETYLVSMKNVNYEILRFTPLYGENFTLNIDKRIFLIRNKVAYYFKKGDYTFSFCSIKNVCKFIDILCNGELKNNIYILADSDKFSVKRIIDEYKKQGRVKITIHMPYYVCLGAIVLIDFFTKYRNKDNYFSKRNFKKLFESKVYSDSKLDQGTLNWNITNTLFQIKIV